MMSMPNELDVGGISVVTTTFNEREFIKPFVDRVRKALMSFTHEVIIVDDSSSDGTYEEARKHADKVVLEHRVGQTKGLLAGLEVAEYPTVVTLDVDLENPPELIPELIKKFLNENLDLLVASRTKLPRFSEKFASAAVGKVIGIGDVYSNFRVYRCDLFRNYEPTLGETFGGELLAYAWVKGLNIGEYFYDPPPRRPKPRIGGLFKANARIFMATAKLLLYLAISRKQKL